MFIQAQGLDELLRKVIEKLLVSKNCIKSTRGSSLELDGVLLHLKDPHCRLSRTEKKGTVLSCLGELLWYLSGSNELSFIEYYLPRYKEDSEDGVSIYGGYGPRLFGMHGENQINNIVSLLRSKPTSRRAVIQLFKAEDIATRHIEIPCTCTLQFLVRNKQLHMFTNMRSNDAFWGLPHDIFCFTMLQEIFARTLGVGVGTYKHAVGSLHLYTDIVEDAQKYLDEGWPEPIPMPPMPEGDPWKSIEIVCKAENDIRMNEEVDVSKLGLPEYWADLVRLLKMYRFLKNNELAKVLEERQSMVSVVYESYVRSRMAAKKSVLLENGQLELIEK